jgi:hypothetical protein
MTDPKQPKFVPVVGGDLTDTSVYSAPGELWDGVLAKYLPAAGTYSAGFTPDMSWFGAQTLNAILQNIGMHIEALADGPTFDTTHPLADRPGNVADYCTTAGDGNPNVNGITDYPLIQASDKFIHAQLGHKNGSVGAGFARRWRQSSRTGNSFESDQTIQNLTSANGPFVDSVSAGDTAAGDGNNPAVLGIDSVTGAMISLGSGRTVTLSTDYGDTWSAATALPTDANWHYPLVACAIGSQWLVVDQIDSTVVVNRVVLSDDLTAATWTVQSSSVGGASSDYIRRITHSNDVAVLLPGHNTLFGYWRPGDTAVTPFRITAADSTRNGWRGAWNEQIGLFLVGNFQGDLWTSADGINWTQIANNQAGLCVRDIVAHGRGFVISNTGVTWAVDYLDFDRKSQARLRNVYRATNQSVGSGFHLAKLGGRWYAGRVTDVVVAGPTNSYRLEWIYSGVNAWDRNNSVGR